MIGKIPNHKPKQQGFTIIELMIATSVFSVVLLLCTFGLMQIGKLYYKGISSTRTQKTTRSVLDMLSQDIEFADNDIVVTGTMICAGHHRYTYQLNAKLDDVAVPHVMVLDDLPGGCDISTPPQTPLSTANGQELLGRNMRLANLLVNHDGAGGYSILVKIIYGDDDLLRDGPNGTLRVGDVGFDIRNATCSGGAGSQFCAVSTLSTFVKKRL